MMRVLAAILTLWACPLWANLEVSLSSSGESSPNKSLVVLSAKNTFSQPIRSAKAWVFAMDAEGRVVGQKSAWIIRPSNTGIDSTDYGLDADQEAEFNIVLDTERSMVSSKVTFTKIILADGTSVDPQMYVVSSPKNEP